MTVQDASALELSELDIVFTALESDHAKKLEPVYARTKPVITTASAFRYETDVPILVPGLISTKSNSSTYRGRTDTGMDSSHQFPTVRPPDWWFR